MVLSVVIPHKAYFDVTFADIPPGWILGAWCLACGHAWPVDLTTIRRRFGADERLRNIDGQLKCRACGNARHNSFTIYGRHVRAAPAAVAGVEDGEAGRHPSLKSMMDGYGG